MSGGAGPSIYWYVARGSGFVAYLLLTAAVILGVALSRRWRAPRAPRLLLDAVHRSLALVFYLFIVVHIVTIYLDPFTHFAAADVLVPFASNYRPLWMSFGIIAAELLAAVGASVWVRRWIGYRAWHALHGLTYPIFMISLLHGLGIGTDTRTSWGTLLYVGSVAAVLAATVWRVAEARTWRRPALVSAMVAVALILTWAATGPYAAGWAAASGTPKVLLQGDPAPDATRGDTSAVSATRIERPAATPRANLRVTISGSTTLSTDRRTVLLRGQSQGATAIEAAIEFHIPAQNNSSSDDTTNGNAASGQDITGQIQLRGADQVALCAGPITSSPGETLIASCSGYGQNQQVEVTFQRLDTNGFTATLVTTN